MLSEVSIENKRLKDYKELIGQKAYDEIVSRGRELKGLRVVHVNATSVGGGVAEILNGLVGLMNDVGLKASWVTIPPDDDFFNVTKKIHNTLQSKPEDLTEEEKQIYTDYNKRLAELMKDMEADIWVIHDPQPAGCLKYLDDNIFAIWRCHIDTTHRWHSVWNFMKQFLTDYKKYIFSLEQFVPHDLDQEKVTIIPPAIDPLSVKNRQMDKTEADEIIRKTGIDPDKPLITQVSRFDPWKDPKGVIEAYQIAKQEIPDLQLALVGLIIAKDDPEAYDIFEDVKNFAGDDPGIFLFHDPDTIPVKNDTFVKAFQTSSDIILQKSTREGFGLVVTEGMWAGNTVIGGNVGGIKLQIEEEETGFLVNSIEETAEHIVYLLKHPDILKNMGMAAHESVKEKYLVTRLLNDYLKVFQEFAKLL